MDGTIQLLFLLAVMVIFWLLMIRPARKAQRTQLELLASLEVGDEVVINSGIFGRIASIEDNTVGLEVAPGTTLKVARQVVVRRVEDEQPEPQENDTPGVNDAIEEN